jgi:hypothetical protein
MNTDQVTRFGVDVRAPGEAELGDEAMNEICTTLRDILAYNPCSSGWRKLLRHLGKTEADDEPLPFRVILESNGLAAALWTTRTRPDLASTWRLLAVRYARRVQHKMNDPRSIAALDVAERHAHGKATDEELAEARSAARAATWAAAWTVARSAARAAWAAAWTVARSAARAAWSDEAARAAWSAETVAAAEAAANGARERQWQAEEFLRVVSGEVKP